VWNADFFRPAAPALDARCFLARAALQSAILQEKRRMLALSRALGIATILLAASAQATILAQWVQLGPDGTTSLRAITDDACPDVALDGVALPMHVRAEPDRKFAEVPAAHFSVRSCEAELPAGVRSAAIAGRQLPLPRPDPQRIVLFGDTGCRLKGERQVQDCNDPAAWPFAKITAAAAAAHPDLVIHLGDYDYRETACPADRTGCSGSPSGYGWEPWKVDFFDPAAPLLATAPWVMVRGNHENCGRAGEGWFRFLDRAPMEAACRDRTGLFVARLGNFGIVDLDSARADDPKKAKDRTDLVALLHDQFETVAGTIPAESWLVTHQPLDAILGVKGRNVVGNSVIEAGLGPSLPDSVRMLVSGHIHFFQALDFGGLHAPQLVVGTGGDSLDPVPPQSLLGAMVNGSRVVSAATYSGFGYMLWERQDAIWSGVLYDSEAKPLGHCRLDGRSLACSS
jgi:hypothetical protein